MRENHESELEAVYEALDELTNIDDVSVKQSINLLEEVQSEIKTRVEALKEDLEAESEGDNEH